MAENAPPPPAPPAFETPSYPALESFIEVASPEEVTRLFESIKQGLAELKGPKVDQGRKVQKAIEAVEELLAHLLQVRERLEQERAAAAKGRK